MLSGKPGWSFGEAEAGSSLFVIGLRVGMAGMLVY